MYYTIKWNGDSVSMLDQRYLPLQEKYQTYTHHNDVAKAIKKMVIRGAPAIGIAAAMGIALGVRRIESDNIDEFRKEAELILEEFSQTRPTAVNLYWTINRMRGVLKKHSNIEELKKNIEQEAQEIFEEDVKINRQIGENGSRFIEDGDIVMTHCNAGALATGGYGTALGVIRRAVEQGKKIEVFACETRPYLQGARLTSWELLQDNIKVTLITDSMSGHFIQKGIIKKIIVGADRIALNGDTANKIGTFTHAVLAREHGIPFYVAAPVSTLDPETEKGDDIPIEERSIDEISYIEGIQIVPEGVFIRNPAFDMTPAQYITAIITEKGVVENPSYHGIGSLLENEDKN